MNKFSRLAATTLAILLLASPASASPETNAFDAFSAKMVTCAAYFALTAKAMLEDDEFGPDVALDYVKQAGIAMSYAKAAGNNEDVTFFQLGQITTEMDNSIGNNIKNWDRLANKHMLPCTALMLNPIAGLSR